jgi:hypothetical protein
VKQRDGGRGGGEEERGRKRDIGDGGGKLRETSKVGRV